MKKNKLISIYTVLIIALSSITFIACSNNESEAKPEVVTLKFKNSNLNSQKSSDSLVEVNINVISYNPLVIESNQVTQIQTNIGTSEEISQGILLNEDYTNLAQNGVFNKLVETSGYIFNNTTQCFMYGTYITDTETGHWTFLFAVPQVQMQMRVCAPSGQMYAKSSKK